MRRLLEQAPMMDRINVTPIIDVALVLVIILLITAPILTVTDRELDLPSARSKETDSTLRIHVTIGRDGALGIEDQLVGPGDFVSALRTRLEEVGADQALVVVRADRAVSHGEVRRLVADTRTAGAQRLAFAVRPEGTT